VVRVTLMIYRRLFTAFRLLFLGACSVGVEPFKTDWLEIPDGKGMEWFYGYWIPPDQHGLNVIGSMFIEPGRIRYEKNLHNHPPVPYRILETNDQYVLALTKDYNGVLGREYYYYSAFFPKLIDVPGRIIKKRFY